MARSKLIVVPSKKKSPVKTLESWQTEVLAITPSTEQNPIPQLHHNPKNMLLVDAQWLEKQSKTALSGQYALRFVRSLNALLRTAKKQNHHESKSQ